MKNLLIAMIAAAARAGTDGTNFFIVGDYGVVTALEQPNTTFDAINKVVGDAQSGSIDDPEFILSVGDNVYPAIRDAPTTAEFELMLGFFKRPNLADLPVWNVRGNHDTYFDWTYELEINMMQSQWQLPAFYYTKLIPAGPNGELLGLLFIDSILMLCSDYTTSLLKDYPLKEPELIELQQSQCADPTWVAWGNSQYDFINQTMQEWDSNPYIIWRATL